MKSKLQNTSGFTLTELLVYLIIAGTVVSIVFGVVGRTLFAGKAASKSAEQFSSSWNSSGGGYSLRLVRCNSLDNDGNGKNNCTFQVVPKKGVSASTGQLVLDCESNILSLVGGGGSCNPVNQVTISGADVNGVVVGK